MGWISGKIWTGYINHGINGVNNSILQRPRKKSTLPPSMSSLIDSKGTPWFISQEITWILLFNLTYASRSSSATTTASMAGVEKKHYCLWFFHLPSRCIYMAGLIFFIFRPNIVCDKGAAMIVISLSSYLGFVLLIQTKE
jgi:hypothetical protein